MEQIKLSIISPVYKAATIVDELVKRIGAAADKITDDYEIVLVEDGGGDDSWERILENAKITNKVKGIKLSRNFGQHYAITAGLQFCSGDYIIIMDCDLQDNPNAIVDLVAKLKDGYDIVFTKRIAREHGLFKKITGFLYNKLISILADKRFDINGGSMVAFNKKVAQAFLQLNERDRLYVQLLKWVGFSQTHIFVQHDKRFEGKSSYTLYKMISLALQGLTSHSNKLLKLSIYFGFIISLLSFLIGFAIILLYFMNGFSPGWPSIFVAISFAAGLILLSNGILGLYIGKAFEQVKNRPLYIVDKKINL